jgi:hypothetical protein
VHGSREGSATIHVAAMNILVDFRHQVRTRSLHGLRILKTASAQSQKALSAVGDGSTGMQSIEQIKAFEKAAKAPLMDILKSCDNVRAEAASKLSAQIGDDSSCSTWKRVHE